MTQSHTPSIQRGVPLHLSSKCQRSHLRQTCTEAVAKARGNLHQHGPQVLESPPEGGSAWSEVTLSSESAQDSLLGACKYWLGPPARPGTPKANAPRFALRRGNACNSARPHSSVRRVERARHPLPSAPGVLRPLHVEGRVTAKPSVRASIRPRLWLLQTPYDAQRPQLLQGRALEPSANIAYHAGDAAQGPSLLRRDPRPGNRPMPTDLCQDGAL